MASATMMIDQTKGVFVADCLVVGLRMVARVEGAALLDIYNRLCVFERGESGDGERERGEALWLPPCIEAGFC